MAVSSCVNSCVLAVLVSGFLSGQKTIHVPADQPSIQIGIAVAEDGDTVLVASGMYQERIDFLGKAINVTSAAGPDITTITAVGLFAWPSGEGEARVVRFISGEGPDSVLEGFTITGQEIDSGTFSGGIHAAGSNPTIRNCIIRDNEGMFGAGIYGSATLLDCVLEGNGFSSSSVQGGGANGTFVMERCVIKDNTGGGLRGGGLMIDCVVQGNYSVEHDGGGVWVPAGGECIIKRCSFLYNIAGTDGHSGGGVAGPAEVYDSLFVGNVGGEFGGGHRDAASAIIGAKLVDGCTVVGNKLYGYAHEGGAIGNCGAIIDTIVWGNDVGSFTATFTPIVTYSCIEGGAVGTGNIDTDPLFIDPASDEYQLQPSSPCIDTGDATGLLDSDGTVADMGAFHFLQAIGCDPGKVLTSDAFDFDHVGHATDLVANFAILGVPENDDAGFETGSAYFFVREGEAWVEKQKVTVSDMAADDRFGHWVAFDGNVALIGARGDDGKGSAYVLERAGQTWAEVIKLMASDGELDDWFASKVALEGSLAVVSALKEDEKGLDAGAVYVFQDTSGVWNEETKLTASDGTAGDEFGKGLAMSGGRILVGANGSDHAGSDSGAAYVFEFDGVSWVETKLMASDAAAGDQFGNEVALDGDVALVAARYEAGRGAVYVFRYDGAAWVEETKLVASDSSGGSEFGNAVAVSGDRALVGARFDDELGIDAGAAYLFEYLDGAWVETKKYTAPDGAPNDQYGTSVALDGLYGLAGAVWDDDLGQDSGSVWGFHVPHAECFPTVAAAPGTLAQFPGVVDATGMNLDKAQQVLVGGLPATILTQTETTISYQPVPGDPEVAVLDVIGEDGATTGTQQMFPILSASTTGVGGTVDVVLENGESGKYIIGGGVQLLTTPQVFSNPPTWFGLFIDQSAPFKVLGNGPIPGGGTVGLSFTAPSSPSLEGLELHLQAWCQQGLPGTSYSFTNVESVTL